MTRQITVSINRARLRGGPLPLVNTDHTLTVTQQYEIGSTNASGAFISLAAAVATALGIASAGGGQSAGQSRSVSNTYTAGPQDPVHIQSDLIAKIVQAESLTAAGDHVLASDGTVLV